jgi:hypothetical protein
LIFPCYRTSSTKICFFLFYSLTLGIAIIFFSAIKNSLTDKMRWDMIRLKSILAALNATERFGIASACALAISAEIIFLNLQFRQACGPAGTVFSREESLRTIAFAKPRLIRCVTAADATTRYDPFCENAFGAARRPRQTPI